MQASSRFILSGSDITFSVSRSEMSISAACVNFFAIKALPIVKNILNDEQHSNEVLMRCQ
jgi:hypothetical protein